MNITREMKSLNRRRYILSQPWLPALIARYPEASWRVTEEGFSGTIYLGYVEEAEFGLPFRDWADRVDSDSWAFDYPIFRRNVGDIRIELILNGYVKFRPDEWDLLVQLGKVHYSKVESCASVYCS
jgi:hypothetical protein